ncbi:MAG: RDD family protein [Lentisphaeraceae bacterium]|nr:RDD family protein [Lentisphaeraceae bacterium]
MNTNIYEAPDSDLEFIEKDQYAIASINQRVMTLILDYVFFYIFAFTLGLLIGILGLSNLIDNINDTVFGLLLILLYYVPQEAVSGKTIGKRIMKTKVVGLDGENINFAKALGRTLCRFIPFEFLSFLGSNGSPQGWHDSIPKTKVITLKKKR